MATSNEAEKARHALRRRRRLRQVLGAVVCVLVVIGLASVISGGVRLTASLFDDTEEKEEFELRLQTLVSLDPEPFDSLESANRARLLDAAIWSVIQQNSDSLDTYERDEVGAMYLAHTGYRPRRGLAVRAGFSFQLRDLHRPTG